MTYTRVNAFFAALLFVLLAPLAVAAQTTHWIQIEAHATLRSAEEFATQYEQRIGNIAGFRIAGGWYALAVGPFATTAEAEQRRSQLLAAREIRNDSYVTDNTIYGQQFWPVGGQATAPAPVVADQPVSAATGNTATTTADASAPATTVAPAATKPAETTPAPPAVIPETINDARRAEYALSRDERAAIQVALQWFGFYNFGIDAAFGPGTRQGIRDWQSSRGYEPWGVLTTAQRDELIASYDAAVARYGFAPYQNLEAGIEVTLPLGLVAYDRIEAPFVHFKTINDSGMRVLLISQQGSQSTLYGLYDILQTLEVIPLDGERNRGRDRFTIDGRSATARAHVEARLRNGEIKGWILLWGPSADADARLVMDTIRNSFRSISGVLPADMGATASTVARQDLVAGLEVRRPVRSRSGFFVDAVGSVVTTAEAVQGCGRVTIDEVYPADVRRVDPTLGIAVLTPRDPLVPIAFAQFSTQPARVGSDIRVSGFSYQDTLTRPILTFGQLAGQTGLNGEPELRRLTLTAQPGDMGGPVFDARGAVMGMLLPKPETPGRMLPADVNFALSSDAIQSALTAAGLSGTPSSFPMDMSAEMLTRVSADLTVLVSCWN